MHTPARTARRRGDRGAVAVEFGLLLPVLLLLLIGVLQYALYFWSMQGGEDAARDAVRRSAVGDFADCSSLRTAVGTQVDRFSVATSPTVSRSYTDVASAPGPHVGDRVAVEVRFEGINLHLPFLPLPHDGDVISRAEARVEYIPGTQESCT